MDNILTILSFCDKTLSVSESNKEKETTQNLNSKV